MSVVNDDLELALARFLALDPAYIRSVLDQHAIRVSAGKFLDSPVGQEMMCRKVADALSRRREVGTDG